MVIEIVDAIGDDNR